LEKEIIGIFSNTFKALYFEYLVGSSAQYFSDLVVIVKKIKQAIHMGKIADPNEKTSFFGQRKETEIHNVKIGGKGKKKTYQDNYGFKTFALLLPYSI